MPQVERKNRETDGTLLLSGTQVQHEVGLSITTLKRRISEGKFPAPIVIGRAKRWSRRVIEQWVTDQALKAAKGNLAK